MEESRRDQKRQSAKKHRERNIYSKKAVRAKEALVEKTSGRAHVNTCAVQPKTSNSTGN
jgi:hypothetical protein